MVEMRTHLATERAGMVIPHLKAGAPEFYPNHMQAGYPEVVSSEIAQTRAPTASSSAEGNTAVCASASAPRPCGVEDPMHA